jgi:hypothetical protein
MFKCTTSENELATTNADLALRPKTPDPYRRFGLWLVGCGLIAFLALRYPGLGAVWVALASRMPHL